MNVNRLLTTIEQHIDYRNPIVQAALVACTGVYAFHITNTIANILKEGRSFEIRCDEHVFSFRSLPYETPATT